jgi:hypothetical protein
MDPELSHFASGPLPEKMVIVMTEAADGIRYRSEIKQAGGQTSVTEYTASYEGALSMVSGPAGLMAPVSLKRIDSHTVEASYVRGLRVVATSRRITSPDNKTMTVTTTSSGPDGQTYTNVAVFKRAA